MSRRCGSAPHPPHPSPRGSVERVRRRHQALDLRLQGIIKLVSVRAEELDTIVGKWVVRGGDDDAGIESLRTDDAGDCRCRQDAGTDDVRPQRAEACGQGRFEKSPRDARVTSDHKSRRMPSPQYPGGGSA